MTHGLSCSLSTKSSLRALEMANKQKIYKKKPLTHHSDRRLQYCSNVYQEILSRKNITPSMTETYDLYQNAVA